ncbi:hypothetical protein JTB14_008856 [Gonioctena quinquepunctata]|nr:hypothetical protein JTB14_008856 [Gonioctena quinquepunctata]
MSHNSRKLFKEYLSVINRAFCLISLVNTQMADNVDITKRILETRKQTEELKAQLQNLIDNGKHFADTGFHSGLANSSDSSDKGKENLNSSPNKVQIIKSFDSKHSKHTSKPGSSKNIPIVQNENKKESPTKTRHYDVEEARQYIKKQRDKRLEQMKELNNHKIQAEIKKKKLEELHKKSLELVTKNVQAKRERSKSRDKNVYVRPDEKIQANKKPQARSRSVSREKIPQNKIINPQNARSRSIARKEDPGRKPTESNSNIPRNPNLLYPPLPPDYIQKRISEENGNNQLQINSPRSIINLGDPKNGDYSFNQIKPIKLFDSPNGRGVEKSFEQNDVKKNSGERSSRANNDLANNQKSTINILSNITLRSASPEHQIEARQRISTTKNCENIDKSKEFTKETQTVETKKEYPKWLQEQPAQGYPFNFINTVKRKLQYSVNSPKPAIDIGIQSSLIVSPTANVEQLKTKKKYKSGKKSKVESFISHRRLNLDPKSIDRLELVPQKASIKHNSDNFQSIVQVDSRTVTKSTETGSESDTSKNIPEISSESGTSLKKNAESVKRIKNPEPKLSIDTEKISSMRLVPQSNNSKMSTIKTEKEKSNMKTESKSKIIESSKHKTSQGISSEDMKLFDKVSIFSNENEYTSDFHSGSELDISDQDSARSRDSIVAFNSPTYSKQVILLSPQYVGEEPRKKSSSEISTETESRTPTTNSKHSKNIPESQQFHSLHTNFHPSQTISNQLSKSDSSLLYVNTRRGTSSSKSEKLSEVPPLEVPDIFLMEPKTSKVLEKEKKDGSLLTKNVTLRSNMSCPAVGLNSSNEIHLKFEAEIHLLNDFNESLRQFAAVEKVFETLKTNNQLTSSKIFQNQDTQTSAVSKSITRTKSSDSETKVTETKGASEKSYMSGVSSINYSRGSFADSVIENDFKMFDNSALQVDNSSLISNKTDMVPATKSSSLIRNLSNFENLQSNNVAGLSLNMFEQLIKDEDARLENLKTILKIREQVLLDRTKGELAWLEIQRKHFKETGQLQEASVIKKKQRGILVNHQKEKHEMQRLKQMQKAASLERKIVLKEQRNFIRRQLSTDSMLKTMKVSTPRDRKHSGPLKVIQNHTESIRSETSISKRSSTDREKEVFSITSHHSIVSKVSEFSENEMSSRDVQSDQSLEQQTVMKKTLLMREEALKKRKKAAEDLLQWHKKLLEEEKRIAELESTASAIISRKPSASKHLEKYKFKGKQLNQLWYNLTSCEERRFVEDKIYPMSQMALERFCKSAREYSSKTKKLLKAKSDSEAKINSVSESIPYQKDSQTAVSSSSVKSLRKLAATNDYMSDFEVESIEDIGNSEDVDGVDRSINLLIDNFSKIKDDIFSLGNNQCNEEEDITEKTDMDSKFDRSESDAEVSVIETNRTSKESEMKSPTQEIKTTEASEIKSLMKEHKVPGASEIKSLGREDATTLAKEKIKSLKRNNNISQSEQTEIESVPEKSRTYGKSEIKSATSENKTSEHSEIKYLTSENKTAKVSLIKSPTEDDRQSEETEIKSMLDKNRTPEESEMKSPIYENNTSEHTEIESVPEKSRTYGKSEIKSATSENKTSEDSEIKSLTSENKTAKASLIKSPTPEETEIKSMSDKNRTPNESEGSDIKSLTEENIKESDESGSPKNLSEIDEQISMSPKMDVESNSKRNIIKSTTEQSLSSTEKDKTPRSAENQICTEDTAANTQISAFTSEAKDSLNETREILSILGESDVGSPEDILEDGNISDNLSTAEDILSRLSRAIPDISSGNKLDSQESDEILVSSLPNSVPEDNISSESLKLLLEISRAEEKIQTDERISSPSKEDVKVLLDISAPEDLSQGSERSDDKIIQEVIEKHVSFNESLVETNVGEVSSEDLTQDLEIVEIKDVEDHYNEENVTTNESKGSSISRVSLLIDEPESPSEEIKSSNEKWPLIEEIQQSASNSGDSSDEPSLDLSYGVVGNDRSEEVEESEKRSGSEGSEALITKEDINSYEEKELDSLSSSSNGLSPEEKEPHEKSVVSSERSGSGESGNGTMDVRTRVSKIMSDANQSSRGDKSPRLQDLYVTTYDLISPSNSPESISPTTIGSNFLPTSSIFVNEAEEILKKQLAIEQEIKAITEQQKKEQQIPLLFVREIPNKPPPPYTPPSSQPISHVATIIPTANEIEEITKYSAKILHKAHLSKNLENISISENTLSLISKNITKECYKFVFDLCKEIAKEHYKQFEEEKGPSWLCSNKKNQLAVVRPYDVKRLESQLIEKLRELFGYEKPMRRENALIKWSRKKRDHVDEILVMESQTEEARWTNFDRDELLVMDQVTNEIMDILLKETGKVLNDIFLKRT